MAGTFYCQRHRSVRCRRVAQFSSRLNTAALIEAAPEPGNILVIDHIVVSEDRIAISSVPGISARSKSIGASRSHSRASR